MKVAFRLNFSAGSLHLASKLFAPVYQLSGREIPDKRICCGLQILSRIDRILVFLAIPKGQWSPS